MIIKAGPVVQRFPSDMPSRIVLREFYNKQTGEVDEIVVHSQVFDGGRAYFASGNYYPAHSFGDRMREHAEAKFAARVEEQLAKIPHLDMQRAFQSPAVIEVVKRLHLDPQMAKVA